MNTRASASRWFSFLLILMVLLGSVAFPRSVHAAGVVVDSLADTTAVDGHCTLREAIENANNNAATNADCAAGSGADTITFSVSGTITLGSTLPTINDPNGLMIDGTGHTLTISGNHAVRVIEVGPSPLTLNALTIANGYTSDWGGGIDNNSGGTLIVTKSTFTGNSSDWAGAIFNGATLIIANSTFTGNSATTDGSAIGSKGGTLRITNSTISGNSAPGTYGGALNISMGTTTLRNTIVANNTGANCHVIAGVITNGGNNIDSGTTCGWGSTNGSKSNTNPLLGARTGSPAYFPLQSGSPALDAGNDAICAAAPVYNKSQNGVTRPQGTHCDIGSFEKPVTKSTSTVTSVAAQDGWILESSETSNAGGTANSVTTTLRLGDDAARKQYRSILSFSTQGLPDSAVITSLTLKIRRQGITGGGNPVALFQGFMVDIMKGTFNLPTLEARDFQTTAASTLYKSFGPYTSAADANAWYTMTLPATAYPYINKLAASSGLTQIRLRFKLDDNNNSFVNLLSLYSGENIAANRPRLIIQYYVR